MTVLCVAGRSNIGNETVNTGRFRPAHTKTLSICRGDMDAMMHVNSAVYFRYMELAWIGWVETWKAQRAGLPPVAEGKKGR